MRWGTTRRVAHRCVAMVRRCVERKSFFGGISNIKERVVVRAVTVVLIYYAIGLPSLENSIGQG